MIRNKLIKTFHPKFSTFNPSRGFTLIEAVIAIAIVGVLGIIISDILSRSFQGGNKSQLLGVIKQNGERSLNSIGQIIRSSDAIVCPVTSVTSSVITVVKDGKYTRIYFKDQTLTANGYIAQDSPVPSSARDAGNLCNMDTYPEVASTKILLTDIDNNSGVSVKNSTGGTSGSFVVVPSPGYKALVTVQFYLMPAISSANTSDSRLGGVGSLDFKTTIQLR